MVDEPQGRRRVIKVETDRRGEKLDIPREPQAYQGYQVETVRRWLVGIMVVLAALLIGLVAALFSAVRPDVPRIPESTGQTTPMTWERSIYSIGAGSDDLLLAPTSVAVAPSGSIYVAEPQRNRVSVFNSAGAFTTVLSPTDTDGTTLFARPESVEVDSDGNVYVCDPVRGQVFAFNAGLQLAHIIPVDDQPTGASAWGGELYVLGRGRVHVIDLATREEVRWFGSFGDGEGEIDANHGIAVNADGVHIADAFNRRVTVFNQEGQWLWEAAGSRETSTAAGWQLPQDLTIDAAGRIVVVDALAFDLSAMLPGSDLISSRWGEFGMGDGQFAYPSSVAYDADRDRFVVADTKNNRVQIVSLPGSAPTVTSIVKKATLGPWRYFALPITAGVMVVIVALLIAGATRGFRRR